MKRVDRDAVIKMLFPALLVLVAYSIYFITYAYSNHSTAEKTLADAKTKAPPAGQLDQLTRDLRKLDDQIRTQRSKIDQVKYAWVGLLGRCANPVNRNERLEKLTQLLDRAHLRFMDDADLDTNKEKITLDHLHKLVDRMDSVVSLAKPRLRQIRCQGRFLDVQRAMQVLCEGPVLALPVGIIMKEAPLDTEWREWILVLWM